MDIHDPVTVYTLNDPVRAEVIKNYLLGEGIRCRLGGANQAGMVGLHFADIEVVVHAADADQARRLIETHESHKGKDRPYGPQDRSDD